MGLFLEPAVTQDREPWRDDWERAEELYDRDEFGEAIPFYEDARRQGLDSSECLSSLGYSYFRVGDYDWSIELFRELTGREPDNEYAFALLGLSHYYKEQFDLARMALAEAVRLDAEDAWVYWALGHARTQTGDYPGAREALERARQIDPDAAKVFECLGYLAWMERKWEESLSFYWKVTEFDPENASAPTDAGRLLLHLRRPREAAAAYREALRRDPGFEKAVNGLAKVEHLCRPFPLNYLSALRQRLQETYRAVVAEEIFAEQDAAFHAYAADGFTRLADWFGMPEDAAWPTRILRGPFDQCARHRVSKEYAIELRAEHEADDWRFAIVGHEMCHRVLATRRRDSLYRHMWVQEMLAEMSAFRLLRETGRGELADRYERQRLEAENAMPVQAVKRARRLFWQRIFWGDAYPEGFFSGMMRFGIALEKTVGWEAMCRLAHCRTWDEWFAGLPDAPTRDAARALLEMPQKKKHPGE